MEQKRFTFSMPIVKAYICKSTGKRILEGVASTTDKDLHGDRMSPAAIQTMADSIKALKEKSGTLNAEHDKSWMSELGDIVELSVDPQDRLVMKAELDGSPLADTLWYKLTEQKKKLGLSIGGFVKSFRIEVDEKTREYMRVFEDIVLDHIAVVSQPANPNTYVSAIAKSVNGLQMGAVVTEKEEEIEVNLLTTDETMTKKNAEEAVASEETVKEEEVIEGVTIQEEVSEGQAEVVAEVKTEGEAEATTEEVAETKEEEASTEEVKEEVAEVKTEEVKEEATVEETEEDKTSTEEEAEKSIVVTKEDLLTFKSEILASIESMLNKSATVAVEVVEVEKSAETTEETTEVKEEVEVVEKSQVEKDLEALKTQVASLEKVAVTKRKTAVEIEKFEGAEVEVATKEAMEVELAEVEKTYKGQPETIFAQKGLIRSRYAKLGIK